MIKNRKGNYKNFKMDLLALYLITYDESSPFDYAIIREDVENSIVIDMIAFSINLQKKFNL